MGTHQSFFLVSGTQETIPEDVEREWESDPPQNSSGVAVERKSSIETEPRTLHEEELQQAREAAIDVLTKRPEEACKIFSKFGTETKAKQSEGSDSSSTWTSSVAATPQSSACHGHSSFNIQSAAV